MSVDFSSTQVDALIKLLLAILLGGMIGLEREFHGRSAGLRTHILVCLGATVIMLGTKTLYSFYPSLSGEEVLRLDPGRIAAGIVTGIGFLGAGTIIRSQDTIRGLTTAACLWLVAALGIAVGSGFYSLAMEAAFLALGVLFVLKRIEGYVHQDWYRRILLYSGRNPNLRAEVQAVLDRHGVSVKRYRIEEDLEHNETILDLNVKFKRKDLGEVVTYELAAIPGAKKVIWR